MNHNLISNYDFHDYMIRSMEEEFQRIVGLSAPLWGWVVTFMLFNVEGMEILWERIMHFFKGCPIVNIQRWQKGWVTQSHRLDNRFPGDKHQW